MGDVGSGWVDLSGGGVEMAGGMEFSLLEGRRGEGFVGRWYRFFARDSRLIVVGGNTCGRVVEGGGERKRGQLDGGTSRGGCIVGELIVLGEVSGGGGWGGSKWRVVLEFSVGLGAVRDFGVASELGCGEGCVGFSEVCGSVGWGCGVSIGGWGRRVRWARQVWGVVAGDGNGIAFGEGWLVRGGSGRGGLALRPCFRMGGKMKVLLGYEGLGGGGYTLHAKGVERMRRWKGRSFGEELGARGSGVTVDWSKERLRGTGHRMMESVWDVGVGWESVREGGELGVDGLGGERREGAGGVGVPGRVGLWILGCWGGCLRWRGWVGAGLWVVVTGGGRLGCVEMGGGNMVGRSQFVEGGICGRIWSLVGWLLRWLGVCGRKRVGYAGEEELFVRLWRVVMWGVWGGKVVIQGMEGVRGGTVLGVVRAIIGRLGWSLRGGGFSVGVDGGGLGGEDEWRALVFPSREGGGKDLVWCTRLGVAVGVKVVPYRGLGSREWAGGCAVGGRGRGESLLVWREGEEECRVVALWKGITAWCKWWGGFLFEWVYVARMIQWGGGRSAGVGRSGWVGWGLCGAAMGCSFLEWGGEVVGVVELSGKLEVKGMRIPDELLTEDITHTIAYKLKPSIPRTPNPKCIPEKKGKQASGESSAPILKMKFKIRAQQLDLLIRVPTSEERENIKLVKEVVLEEEVDKIVEGDEEVDKRFAHFVILSQEDPGTRIDLGSHKESIEEEKEEDDDDDDDDYVDITLIRKKRTETDIHMFVGPSQSSSLRVKHLKGVVARVTHRRNKIIKTMKKNFVHRNEVQNLCIKIRDTFEKEVFPLVKDTTNKLVGTALRQIEEFLQRYMQTHVVAFEPLVYFKKSLVLTDTCRNIVLRKRDHDNHPEWQKNAKK
ncbi:hypothetical protein Tco_1515412 [Tanacetum coccineum]